LSSLTSLTSLKLCSGYVGPLDLLPPNMVKRCNFVSD
jgi:hypothetical protein